jgi:hypothetical protein
MWWEDWTKPSANLLSTAVSVRLLEIGCAHQLLEAEVSDE